MADPLEMSQNQGAVGGAIVGSVIGGQSAQAMREIMRAKARRYPIPVALLGSGMSIGGILGGIQVGKKMSEKGKLPEVELSEELDTKAKRHKGMKKHARLWFPIVSARS